MKKLAAPIEPKSNRGRPRSG